MGPRSLGWALTARPSTGSAGEPVGGEAAPCAQRRDQQRDLAARQPLGRRHVKAGAASRGTGLRVPGERSVVRGQPDQVVHAGTDREGVGATETVDLKRVDKRAELLGGDPADASRGGTRPVDLDGARGGVDREGVVGLAAIDDHAVIDGVAAEIGVDLTKRAAIDVVDREGVAAAEGVQVDLLGVVQRP